MSLQECAGDEEKNPSFSKDQTNKQTNNIKIKHLKEQKQQAARNRSMDNEIKYFVKNIKGAYSGVNFGSNWGESIR